MTYLSKSWLGEEIRCEPGEAEYPHDCQRHQTHYWCDVCQGHYGVPHADLHQPGHVDRWFRNCVCRPCTERRAELATEAHP